jgi:hypothetical protein
VAGPVIGPGPAYQLMPVSGPVPLPVSGPAYPGLPVPVGRPLCTIGEITVTDTMIHTPTGSCPLRGSQWHVQDQWLAHQRTPTWAIVCAVVGFCLVNVFSLLFLLAKETRFTGVAQVTVVNGPFVYTAHVPVYNAQTAFDTHNRVNYVRAMSIR